MQIIRNTLAASALALAPAAPAPPRSAATSGTPATPRSSIRQQQRARRRELLDDAAKANNTALYTFTVTMAGTVTIASASFAGGGVDPYFTLFNGSGDTATFLASNYDQATTTGGDFPWSGTLGVGTYEFAIGAFENMSYAEQDSSQYTLYDGFIGIGDPNSLGSGAYSVTLTTPVPEPTGLWMMSIGLAALTTRAWRARRNGWTGVSP